MPLNPTGSNPVLIIQFGGQDSGLCDLYFQNKPITRFDNSKPLYKYELDPMLLFGSARSTVSNLIGTEVGWVVTFTNLASPTIQFSFDLDIRQDGASIITPIEVTETSTQVVNAGLTLIFNGFLTLT
jgi:hypothetical protein